MEELQQKALKIPCMLSCLTKYVEYRLVSYSPHILCENKKIKIFCIDSIQMRGKTGILIMPTKIP